MNLFSIISLKLLEHKNTFDAIHDYMYVLRNQKTCQLLNTCSLVSILTRLELEQIYNGGIAYIHRIGHDIVQPLINWCPIFTALFSNICWKGVSAFDGYHCERLNCQILL